MATLLKQSTAISALKVGPFVDSIDGFTLETGLSLAATDFLISKADGTFAAKNDATAGSHSGSAWYNCSLNATDTNTLGRFIIFVSESGALPVWHEFLIVPANVYDALVGGTDVLQADMTQVLGAAVSTSTAQIGANMVSGSAGAITATVIATGAVDADALATDAVTEMQAGLATSAALTTAQADLDNIQTRLPTSLVSGRIDASVGAMAADVLTAAAAAADFGTEMRTGLALSADLATAQSDLDNIQTRLPTSLVSGRIDASVGAMAADVITSAALAASATGEIADGVWDEVIAEISTLPGTDPTARAILAFLKALHAHRRTQASSGVGTLYEDDGTTALATSTRSDDGTTLNVPAWSDA